MIELSNLLATTRGSRLVVEMPETNRFRDLSSLLATSLDVEHTASRLGMLSGVSSGMTLTIPFSNAVNLWAVAAKSF